MGLVPLNMFQRIMRLWDEVHPYNAVHACRIEGAPDIDRIRQAWQKTLAGLGLGHVRVQGIHYTHIGARQDESNASLQIHPETKTLDQLISDEMNTRMDPTEGCPFRAFVLPSNGSYCIGINYHHWVADSASIRWLMRDWFANIQNPSAANSKKAAIPAKGHWHFFGPTPGRWRLHEGFLALLRYRTRFARARLIEKEVTDCKVAVTFHELPDGIATPLAKLAKQHHVTFNDLMLAAFSQVIDRHGASPRKAGRDELALGTIVDLRSSARQPMDHLFGLFLGFTSTMVRPADLASWPRLLNTVARQNAYHKQSRTAHASILRTTAAVTEAKMMTPSTWAEAYRRRLPLAGGISNVNMNRTWVHNHHPSPILDYYRVAPTGPLLPIAFTPTTLGNRVNFGLTRLTCLFDDAHNALIANSMRNRLIELTEAAR